jgi:hypothetical protein
MGGGKPEFGQQKLSRDLVTSHKMHRLSARPLTNTIDKRLITITPTAHH